MEALATNPKQLVPTDRDLLRPDQIDEMEQEKASLVAKMHNPVIEKGPVREQLRRLEHQLETQRPKLFEGQNMDRAVAREGELREQIRQGMLSQEEMRKSPPGAGDRHREWETANVRRITEWQNLQRCMNAGNDKREVASIETFRPTTSTMNMHNAQIEGKMFFLPPYGAEQPVTFNDDQIAVIRALNPALAEQLGTMSNEARKKVKEALAATSPQQTPDAVPVATGAVETPVRRKMSEEHKETMRLGREAAKKAKK